MCQNSKHLQTRNFIILAQILGFVVGMVENIVGERKNAVYGFLFNPFPNGKF